MCAVPPDWNWSAGVRVRAFLVSSDLLASDIHDVSSNDFIMLLGGAVQTTYFKVFVRGASTPVHVASASDFRQAIQAMEKNAVDSGGQGCIPRPLILFLPCQEHVTTKNQHDKWQAKHRQPGGAQPF